MYIVLVKIVASYARRLRDALSLAERLRRLFMLGKFSIVVAIIIVGLTHQIAFGNEDAVISWNTEEGMHRLSTSKHKVDFFPLANNFESQTNKIFCGPTSSAIVLNALRVRKAKFELPIDTSLLSAKDLLYLPLDGGRWTPFYHRYTQNNVIYGSPKHREFILGKPIIGEDGKKYKDFGLTLLQLSDLLRAHNLDVTHYLGNSAIDNKAVKQSMIDNLKTKDDYIIINYYSPVLNQPGGGHISPLGAYHEPTDSFLIMDVTPNKADWVWVNADVLMQSMNTLDNKKYRGFVMVKEFIDN